MHIGGCGMTRTTRPEPPRNFRLERPAEGGFQPTRALLDKLHIKAPRVRKLTCKRISDGVTARSRSSPAIAALRGERPGRRCKMTDDPMHPSGEPLQLRSAPRCGAKTRSGRPCQSPVVAGRPRCRMHGGVKGSGGPRGRRNGNYKHGRYTAEARVHRQWVRERIGEIQAFIDKTDEIMRALRPSRRSGK
jgi:hypothetical protein